MRVLFIGDSIIRGSVGVNWVNDITGPVKTIANRGVNGDTLARINQRLYAILRKDASFDAVVFCGGANDILIPYLSSKGFLFKAAQKYLLRKGYSPCRTMEEFEYGYTKAIKLIRRYCKAEIILLTLGRMNERAEFVLNHQRAAVNLLIRRLAMREGCRLADAGKRIDEYLNDKSTRDYFLEGFFNTSWFDQWQCRLFKRADSLSEERGLILTIDGAHVNSIGGAIFRDEVEKHLFKIEAGVGSRLDATGLRVL
jgi:lysophospholipase L1-like esterase